MELEYEIVEKMIIDKKWKQSSWQNVNLYAYI